MINDSGELYPNWLMFRHCLCKDGEQHGFMGTTNTAEEFVNWEPNDFKTTITLEKINSNQTPVGIIVYHKIYKTKEELMEDFSILNFL
jgi:hypothetical protein